MKLQPKNIISLMILVAIVLFFVYYVQLYFSDFKQLANVGFSHFYLVILVALLSLIFALLNGILLDMLMRPFGIKLAFREWFGLSIITNFYNLITPFRGGMAARAVYLKKKYNFSYLNFLATLSAIYVIIFFVGSFGVLLSMLFIWVYYGFFNAIIFALFLGMTIIFSFIIIFSPKLPEAKNKWVNKIIKVINGWHLIKNNKKIIFSTAIISLFQLAIGALNTIITYSIFGIHISFFKALFITSVSYVSIIVAITPGNLGVGDAINIFSATLIGIGLKEAVVATVLGRTISLVVIFILGPIFSYLLLRGIRKK